MHYDAKFNELYSFLTKESKNFTIGELSVLYFCLYKEKTHQKKRADILKGIFTCIEQSSYFNNMDLKYQGCIYDKKNNDSYESIS